MQPCVSGSGIGGKNSSPEQENAVMEGSTAVRYSEAKIKEAILHADIEIRDRATSYFAKSFCMRFNSERLKHQGDRSR